MGGDKFREDGSRGQRDASHGAGGGMPRSRIPASEHCSGPGKMPPTGRGGRSSEVGGPWGSWGCRSVSQPRPSGHCLPSGHFPASQLCPPLSCALRGPAPFPMLSAPEDAAGTDPLGRVRGRVCQPGFPPARTGSCTGGGPGPGPSAHPQAPAPCTAREPRMSHQPPQCLAPRCALYTPSRLPR